jgi:GST-like protein
MIDLYSWATSNGHKVHIMLEETGLPYNVHPINIGEGDQFRPDFLKISPNNKIPAIVDRNGPNGKPITIFESAAILIYLANKTGQFLPRDERKYYDVLQWLMFQMASVGPMLGQANHFRSYAPARFPKEQIEYGQERYGNEANRIFGVLDRRLAAHEWVAADEYTIADIAIFPWLRNPDRFGVDIAKYPHVKRWWDHMALRPAVQRGLKVLTELRPAGPHSDKAWDVLYGKTQYAARAT